MIDSAFDFRRNGRVGVSLPELALVVLLHALGVWLLLSLDVMPRPVQRKPIMVRIIPPQIPAMGSGSMPAETHAPPQPELHIRAERTTAYEKVAQIMSEAARNGLSRIGFVTDPTQQQPMPKSPQAAPLAQPAP